MAKVRVLVVDDEPGIREIIKEYFEPEGFIVDQAADGVEALELFKKSRYSLVILDIMMPKADGWTVCREIRRTSQVPVIMLSARGEEYDKLFGFELGVDDYMVKPFSPRELLARSKAVIR
ncbi:MAG TPA: response regulator, partial [Bacillota bacterium]|nr:response regulator [Bacillota bacterium]